MGVIANINSLVDKVHSKRFFAEHHEVLQTSQGDAGLAPPHGLLVGKKTLETECSADCVDQPGKREIDIQTGIRVE